MLTQKSLVQSKKKEEIFPEINNYIENEITNYEIISKTLTLLNQTISEFIFQKKSNIKKEIESQKPAKLKEDDDENFNKKIVKLKLILKENEIDRVLDRAKKALEIVKDKKSTKKIENIVKKTNNIG